MKTRILLIKVPICYFPNEKTKKGLQENYAVRSAFQYGPPLALALIAASLKNYLKFDYELTVRDINEVGLSIKKYLMEDYLQYLEQTLSDNYDIILISCQYMFNQNWVNYR